MEDLAVLVIISSTSKHASKSDRGPNSVHDPKDNLICKCFRKVKDRKLQTKKSAQNTSRKAKSASAYVARASEVASDYESAEEDFQASGASISWNALVKSCILS